MATLSELLQRSGQDTGRPRAITKPAATGGSQLSQLLQRQGAPVGVTPERKEIFSGGLFMDVIDALSVPSYVVGGLISGEGAIEGIKKRIMPSETLVKKKKGVIGFAKSLAADIIFDPLTYLTFGASAVLKAGGVKVAGKYLSKEGTKKFAEIEGRQIAQLSTKKQAALQAALAEAGVKTVQQLAPKAQAKTLAKAGITQTERSNIRDAASKQILDAVDATGGRNSSLLERGGIWLDIPFIQAAKKIPFTELPGPARAVTEVVGRGFTRALAPIIPFAKIKLIPDEVLAFGQKTRLIRSIRELNSELASGKLKGVEIAAQIEKKFGADIVNAVPDIIEEIGRDVSQFTKAGVKVGVTNIDQQIGKAIEKGIIKGENAKKLLGATNEIRALLLNLEKETVRLGMDKLLTEIGYVPRTAKEKGFLRSLAGVTPGSVTRPDFAKRRVYGRAITKDGESVVGFYSNSGKKFTTLDGEVLDFFPAPKAKKTSRDILAKAEKSAIALLKVGKVDESADVIKRAQQEAEEILMKTGFIKKDAKGNIIKTYTILSATKAELKAAGIDTLEDRFAIPLAGRIAKKNMLEAQGKFAKKLADDVGATINPADSFSMMGARQITEAGITPGFVNMEKFMDNKMFRGVQMPEEVADAVKGYVNINTDKESQALGRAFDSVNRWWKNFALIAPAYHSRNAVGNFFNNWLGGFSDPQLYKDAAILQIGKAGKLTARQAEILNAAKRLGVNDTGFYGSELSQTISDQMSKPGWNPLAPNRRNLLFGTQGALSRSSRAFGTFMEDNARLASFMDRLNKGDSFAEASEHVKKFLFDYGELTNFERKVLKRIIPFYTWTRKNMPLQVEMLVKEPRKALGIFKAQEAMEAATIEPGEKEDILAALPEWMQGGHPIILPFKDPNTGNPVVISGQGFLPLYDLTRIGMKSSFDDLVNMISPIIKFPLLELPKNLNLFKGDRLDPTEPEGAFLWPKIFESLFSDDTPRSKFLYAGMFNETQKEAIKNFYRPVRELDNFFELGKTPEERSAPITRWSALLIARARPIDVFEGKQWNAYQDKKSRDAMLDGYARSYRNFLRFENDVDQTNMNIWTKRINKEYGIKQDELDKIQREQLRNYLNWDTIEGLVKDSLKTGEPVDRAGRDAVIRQIANSYKDKSIKMAIQSYNRVEQKTREDFAKLKKGR